MRIIFMATAAVALSACTGTSTDTPTPLFADDSLKGWQQEGPAAWRIRGTSLDVEPGAAPSYLINAGNFGDYTLEMDVSCPSRCAPGLFLRRTPAANGVQGIQISLAGDDAGAAYAVSYDPEGRETARDALLAAPTASTTETRKIRVSLEGRRIAISVNGTEQSGTVPDSLLSGGIVVTTTAPGSFTLKNVQFQNGKADPG